MIVTRTAITEDRFLPDEIVFPATLVLRSPTCDASGEAGLADAPHEFQIELYDPSRIEQIAWNGSPRTLARDISAPLVYRLRDQRSNAITNFITPGAATGQSRLFSLEPFQADKIPVVLVHGLLSDPFTWVEATNELLAMEGFVEHYQLWYFEYPTGQPFLSSAASLREQLQQVHDTYADRCAVEGSVNGSFSNAIVVGHSMGGLIAKLLVTSSEDRLWDSIACSPFDKVRMTQPTREQLARGIFFEPSPQVTRVVYMAAPHKGSVYARRLVGRIGSALVSEPELQRQRHRTLMECNPDIFSKEFSRRIPTSIDLLNPTSPLLNAMDDLPANPNVTMHSIIGQHGWTLGFGPSDGVVPVSSAKEFRAVSECFVNEKHEDVNKHPDAIIELKRILQQHLDELH